VGGEIGRSASHCRVDRDYWGGFIRSTQQHWLWRAIGGVVALRRRSWRWVRPDARERIAARLVAGESVRALAAEFGCSDRTVTRIGVAAVWEGWRARRSPRRLSFAEREQISRALAAGESNAQIARALGRHRSTIGREIALSCGGQRSAYRALAAERRARQRARRPKATKLAGSPRLLAEVEAGLSAALVAAADRGAAQARSSR
jgi:Helix-turn-helix domain